HGRRRRLTVPDVERPRAAELGLGAVEGLETAGAEAICDVAVRAVEGEVAGERDLAAVEEPDRLARALGGAVVARGEAEPAELDCVAVGRDRVRERRGRRA